MWSLCFKTRIRRSTATRNWRISVMNNRFEWLSLNWLKVSAEVGFLQCWLELATNEVTWSVYIFKRRSLWRVSLSIQDDLTSSLKFSPLSEEGLCYYQTTEPQRALLILKSILVWETSGFSYVHNETSADAESVPIGKGLLANFVY